MSKRECRHWGEWPDESCSRCDGSRSEGATTNDAGPGLRDVQKLYELAAQPETARETADLRARLAATHAEARRLEAERDEMAAELQRLRRIEQAARDYVRIEQELFARGELPVATSDDQIEAGYELLAALHAGREGGDGGRE